MYFRSTVHLAPDERLKKVIDELSGIGGGRTLGFGKDRIRSLPDAIAKVLTMHFEYLRKQQQTNGHGEEQEVQLVDKMEQPALIEESSAGATAQVQAPAEGHYDICPECGQALLAREEGCAKCYGCGHSEC